MRAAVVTAFGRLLEVVERPVPEPGGVPREPADPYLRRLRAWPTRGDEPPCVRATS